MKKIRLKIKSEKNKTLIKNAILNNNVIFDDNSDDILIEEEIVDTYKYLNVKTIQGTAVIREDQIYALESFDHQIYIYCDETYETRIPLKDLIKELSNDFIQINQSTIINKKKIIKILASLNKTYSIYLENKKKYVVSRTYFNDFNNEMGI